MLIYLYLIRNAKKILAHISILLHYDTRHIFFLILIRSNLIRLSSALDRHGTVTIKWWLLRSIRKLMSKEWFFVVINTFFLVWLSLHWLLYRIGYIAIWALFLKRLCLWQFVTFWFFYYLSQSGFYQRRALKILKLMLGNKFCIVLIHNVSLFHRSYYWRWYRVALPSLIWVLSSKFWYFHWSLWDLVIQLRQIILIDLQVLQMSFVC
jgi:hypothetical protein